jgi:hypothetical protein
MARRAAALFILIKCVIIALDHQQENIFHCFAMAFHGNPTTPPTARPHPLALHAWTDALTPADGTTTSTTSGRSNQPRSRVLVATKSTKHDAASADILEVLHI